MGRGIVSLFTLFLMCGCSSGVVFQPSDPEDFVHYRQLKEVENLSQCVIFFNEGDPLPLKVTLDSEIIGINTVKSEKGEFQFIAKKKIYFKLRMPEKVSETKWTEMKEAEKEKFLKEVMIYLSLDTKHWAPANDVKAIKDVLKIKGGRIAFGMGLTKEEGLKLFFHAQTNAS